LLTTVIILVMIGPEERKVDHIIEHATEQHYGEEKADSSDLEKVHDRRESHNAPSEHTLEESQLAKGTEQKKLSSEEV
jgi:hypothetical protein